MTISSVIPSVTQTIIPMTQRQREHLDRKWVKILKREFQFNRMYREKFGREKPLPLPR